MRTPQPLLIIIFAIATIAFESCKKEPGCTSKNSYNYDTDAEKNDGTCVPMDGCLGYRTDYSNIGSYGYTFNDVNNDNQFWDEVNRQQNFWDSIPATVYVWYEPYNVMNAVSTTEGNIMYGFNLFYHTVNNNFGDNAVDGILAHEWGHQVQFNNGWMQQGTFLSELEADAFAGFYIAAAKQWNTSMVNGFLNSVYYSGSYDYNSPDFHGTPDQRSAAAQLGIDYGINAVNGTNYTYAQLHANFTNNIRAHIMREANVNGNPADRFIADIATGKSKIKEIVYPALIHPVHLKK